MDVVLDVFGCSAIGNCCHCTVDAKAELIRLWLLQLSDAFHYKILFSTNYNLPQLLGQEYLYKGLASG